MQIFAHQIQLRFEKACNICVEAIWPLAATIVAFSSTTSSYLNKLSNTTDNTNGISPKEKALRENWVNCRDFWVHWSHECSRICEKMLEMRVTETSNSLFDLTTTIRENTESLVQSIS